MNWRKLNNILHRDVGYFFVGMTIIYAISGLAINHVRDWNPNFSVDVQKDTVELPASYLDIFKDDMVKVLEEYGQEGNYKSFFFPDTATVKVFFSDHNMEIDIASGEATIEWLTRRPILFEMNLMHYNPGIWWTIFADIYAVGLLLLAITGMFVLRGKKGLSGRGKWFVGAGVIIPLILLLLYI